MFHARATISRKTLAATVEATKLITNAIKIDGRLKGRAPDTYDGDRTKAEKFVVDFELFWMNNEEHGHMKNPYKQCTYFLGLCSGEQIKNWVIHQVKELKEKTTWCSDLIGKGKEVLWKDLVKNFANAFTWTGKIKYACMKLNSLEIKDNNIDNYIAKFENLLAQAEIPCDNIAPSLSLKQGFTKGYTLWS